MIDSWVDGYRRAVVADGDRCMEVEVDDRKAVVNAMRGTGWNRAGDMAQETVLVNGHMMAEGDNGLQEHRSLAEVEELHSLAVRHKASALGEDGSEEGIAERDSLVGDGLDSLLQNYHSNRWLTSLCFLDVLMDCLMMVCIEILL